MQITTDDLRGRYGDRAKDVIASLYSFAYKGNDASCPFHEDKTPSFKWYKDGNFWKCFSCGEKLDIFSAYEDKYNIEFKEAFNKVKEEMGLSITDNVKDNGVYIKPKEYTKPNVKHKELGDQAVREFKDRGISTETLNAFDIGEVNYYRDGIIPSVYFPYYDDNGEEVFGKYRAIGYKKGDGKKSWRVSGSKPILWGMNNIDKHQTLVICEGEIDALSIYESGYTNVVSIPSGTSDLSWIENCFDWLEEIPLIILIADNDKAGEEFIANTIIRYGSEKMAISTVPKQHNDVNELLVAEGIDNVLKCIKTYRLVGNESAISLSSIKVNRELESIPTGFHSLSHILEGFRLNELTILTGENGSGKSTFLGQILLNIVEGGYKAGVFSAELSHNQYKSWILSQACNQSDLVEYRNKYGKIKYIPKDYAVKKIDKWFDDNAYLYDSTKSSVETKAVLKSFSYLYRRLGVKFFVIDNFLTLGKSNYGANELKQETEAIVDMVNFVKKYPVHIILVAHPNKSEIVSKKSIAGSGNITNLADNVLIVHRMKKGGDHDMNLEIVKNREAGDLGEVKMIFDKATRRFKEINFNEKYVINDYSWRKL